MSALARSPTAAQRHAGPFETWASDGLGQLLGTNARLDRADRDEQRRRRAAAQRASRELLLAAHERGSDEREGRD